MSHPTTKKNNNNDNDNKPDLEQPLLDPVQMIHIRRHGIRKHSDAELQWFLQEYTAGHIPEYQMAAWLMAVCFHPLSQRETATLTDCMVQSTPGGRLNWSLLSRNNTNNKNDNDNDTKRPVPPPTPPPRHLVDKHSTGGVGDKVSIILVPLVSYLGVSVPMLAGRGLGHTGGTIDKLESIPGFRTNLSVTEFQQTVQQIGACINGAGVDLCPTDQKLYALRDVTATVESIPLQTASIMCKKIAESPASLVLDVKYGSGAFQATAEQAAELAKSMVYTGHANGLNPTTAFLTQMNQPLGYAIGNWYEIQECLEILKGDTNGQDGDGEQQWKRTMIEQQSYDLIALVCLQAGQMLYQSGLYQHEYKSLEECTRLAYDTLRQGKALEQFRKMALAQGAELDGAESLWYPTSSSLYSKPRSVVAKTTGRIVAMETRQLGLLAVALGAGRRMVQDPVDPYAGILVKHKLGSWVRQGDVMLELYAPDSKWESMLLPSQTKNGIQSFLDQAADCITIVDDNDDGNVSSSSSGVEQYHPVVTHCVTVEGGVQEIPFHQLPTVVQDLYRETAAIRKVQYQQQQKQQQ